MYIKDFYNKYRSISYRELTVNAFFLFFFNIFFLLLKNEISVDRLDLLRKHLFYFFNLFTIWTKYIIYYFLTL